MKIRNGFVSNSSTASYYIKLKGSAKQIEDDLIYTICEYAIRDDYLEELLENHLKITKLSINMIDQGLTGWLMEPREELEKRKEKIIKNLEFVRKSVSDNNYKTNKLVKIALDTCGIVKKKEKDAVTLEYFTPVHECYTEGLHQILQELLLMNSFGLLKSKIEAKMESYN